MIYEIYLSKKLMSMLKWVKMGSRGRFSGFIRTPCDPELTPSRLSHKKLVFGLHNSDQIGPQFGPNMCLDDFFSMYANLRMVRFFSQFRRLSYSKFSET
jgi:hypothetical protein